MFQKKPFLLSLLIALYSGGVILTTFLLLGGIYFFLLKELDTGKEKNSCQDSSSGVERNKQREEKRFFLKHLSPVFQNILATCRQFYLM